MDARQESHTWTNKDAVQPEGKFNTRSQKQPQYCACRRYKIGDLLHTTVRAIIMTRAVPTLRVGRNICLLWVRVDG